MTLISESRPSAGVTCDEMLVAGVRRIRTNSYVSLTYSDESITADAQVSVQSGGDIYDKTL